MIAMVLPDHVVVSWCLAGETRPCPISEADLVQHAVRSRRAEFAAGRTCAHQALTAIGAPVTYLGREPDGSASWPPQVRGSITHYGSYTAAAVALTSTLHHLGIDVTAHRLLSTVARRRLVSAEEAERLAALESAGHDLRWDAILFSAKESYVKAWRSGGALTPGLTSVRVALRGDGTFTATSPSSQISCALPQGGLDGRWAVRADRIFTAIAT